MLSTSQTAVRALTVVPCEDIFTFHPHSAWFCHYSNLGWVGGGGGGGGGSGGRTPADL